MKAIATIDSDGRMKLPRKVTERLNLQPGSKVSVVIEDGITKLAVADVPLGKVVSRGGNLVIECPTVRKVSDEAIVSAIKADRDDRGARIIGCLP